MRKAVIDVGSNSVLLVVEEKTPEGWAQIYEATSVTALGEGTKSTGLLGETGMVNSLEALKQMFRAAREHGVGDVLAAVTMAGRIARNTPEFLARAQEQGTPLIVLTGDQEAELGFRAVASDATFSNHDRLSIVDPGGHSTELLTADRDSSEPSGWRILFRRSYPVGTLGLRSGVLSGESPDSLATLRACKEIDDLIGLEYRPGTAGHVVVLGATGTNLISIREQMTSWQPEKVHGAYLDYEEISKSVGWMMPMTDEQRAAILGMEKGREKTLHLGALILERFLHSLHVLGCSVSVRGWRHALLEQGLPEV